MMDPCFSLALTGEELPRSQGVDKVGGGSSYK